jgi:hypothetical protein
LNQETAVPNAAVEVEVAVKEERNATRDGYCQMERTVSGILEDGIMITTVGRVGLI